MVLIFDNCSLFMMDVHIWHHHLRKRAVSYVREYTRTLWRKHCEFSIWYLLCVIFNVILYLLIDPTCKANEYISGKCIDVFPILLAGMFAWHCNWRLWIWTEKLWLTKVCFSTLLPRFLRISRFLDDVHLPSFACPPNLSCTSGYEMSL